MTEVRYEIYGDDREHCFEMTYFIGRTWMDDYLMGSREVEMGMCK